MKTIISEAIALFRVGLDLLFITLLGSAYLLLIAVIASLPIVIPTVVIVYTLRFLGVL